MKEKEDMPLDDPFIMDEEEKEVINTNKEIKLTKSNERLKERMGFIDIKPKVKDPFNLSKSEIRLNKRK